MKIANIAASEIDERRMFRAECNCCGDLLQLNTPPEARVADFLRAAASEGWHSVETTDEIIACACPKCIAEIKQNELEA